MVRIVYEREIGSTRERWEVEGGEFEAQRILSKITRDVPRRTDHPEYAAAGVPEPEDR